MIDLIRSGKCVAGFNMYLFEQMANHSRIIANLFEVSTYSHENGGIINISCNKVPFTSFSPVHEVCFLG